MALGGDCETRTCWAIIANHAERVSGEEGSRNKVGDEQSPVYLLPAARPWFRSEAHPRRGAVSSFGFGGTNFHAVLEEYSNGYLPRQGTLGADAWPHELVTMAAPAFLAQC